MATCRSSATQGERRGGDPVRRPIDGDGASSLACRSPGPARSTPEKAAHVRCDIGSCGVPRPSLEPYVTEDGGHGWAPAPEGAKVGYALITAALKL